MNHTVSGCAFGAHPLISARKFTPCQRRLSIQSHPQYHQRSVPTAAADPRKDSSMETGASSVLRLMRSLDREASHVAFHSVGQRLPRLFLMQFEHAGNGLFWLPGALALWMLPSLTPLQRLYAANFLAGLVLDIIAVGSLKSTFRRGRPLYNRADDFVVVVSVDKFSFPSGHASRASFIAFYCVVCLNNENPLLAIMVLSWGMLTAISRALLGRHYLGDVLAGVLVGACVATCVCQASLAPGEFLVSQQQSDHYFGVVAEQLSQLTWPLPLAQYFKL